MWPMMMIASTPPLVLGLYPLYTPTLSYSPYLSLLHSKQERLRAIVSDLFRPIDQSHISKFDAHRKRHASADPDNFVQPKRIYLSPLLPDNFDKLLNDCTPNLNIMNSLANRHDAVPQCDGLACSRTYSILYTLL